jgi:serine/threonine-protein kinase
VAVATGEPKPDPSDPDTVLGQTIGGCVIFALLGAGGMGRVYLAHHESLCKDVVVKILPAELAKNKRTVERFLREARSAARLEHLNVVAVHDVGTTDAGLHYMIMQYVDGPNVEDLIVAQGPSEPASALALITQAADALAAAHRANILHRDIKPDNLLLTASGTLKVADFGLAKDLNSELRLTADGCMIGTPLYMAPEIGRVKAVDGRVDIYSLGVVFYYLLTGVQPFRGFSVLDILSAKAHDALTPPEQLCPHLSDDYRRVLGKMLVKDRDRRYATISALQADLDRLRRGLKIDVAPDDSPWAEPPAPATVHSAPSSDSTSGTPAFALLVAAAFVLGLLGVLIALLAG